jgi:hypothetical protein
MARTITMIMTKNPPTTPATMAVTGEAAGAEEAASSGDGKG